MAGETEVRGGLRAAKKGRSSSAWAGLADLDAIDAILPVEAEPVVPTMDTRDIAAFISRAAEAISPDMSLRELRAAKDAYEALGRAIAEAEQVLKSVNQLTDSIGGTTSDLKSSA